MQSLVSIHLVLRTQTTANKETARALHLEISQFERRINHFESLQNDVGDIALSTQEKTSQHRSKDAEAGPDAV